MHPDLDLASPSTVIPSVAAAPADSLPGPSSSTNSSNVLVISNRLPVTIKRSPDGTYQYAMSSGGLVSALSGLKKSKNFKWFGWPGLEVPDAEMPRVREDLMNKFSCIPVFISDETADLHYNGFSNS